jgi:hypothetical protein
MTEDEFYNHFDEMVVKEEEKLRTSWKNLQK